MNANETPPIPDREFSDQRGDRDVQSIGMESALRELLSRRERKRAEKIAERLGVGLGPGLSVRGHHGSVFNANGCGLYDLVLNLDAERVDCANCGATDLLPSRVVAMEDRLAQTKRADKRGDDQ